MTEAHNAATYRRWFDEGCSQGNVDLADELYSPDYVTHALGPDFAPTLEGLKMFIRALREGMPDLHSQWKRWSRRATAWRVGFRCRARTTEPCSAAPQLGSRL
jgi:SnoaL-like protein